MKLFLIAFAVIAAVAADVSHLPSNEYLPPVQEAAPVQAPSNEYLAPVQQAPIQSAPVEVAPAHELADDGYRYKTQRRVVFRQRRRRDVSHLSSEYLPPVQEAAPVQAPTNEYLPPVQQAAPIQAAPVEVAPAHELADDGYRYKTHRRVVYRQRRRRDVSHLSSEYLPPVQEAAPVQAPTNEYLPPVQQAAPIQSAPVEVAPAHELADDGYRYKTQRRVVYRQRRRRDVNNEYLPPVQEEVVQAPSTEYLAPVEAEPAHELADDGYRYKTHRRVVYRQRRRRDVNNEYLPPVQEAEPVQAPSNEYLAPVEAEPAHELADDGYRYKTHRRVVYRQRRRRDVSHLSSEYLPPVQESAPVQAPTNEYLPPVQQAAPIQSAPVEVAPAHELADDGYRYKTHRRVVYRQRRRRDVNNEYLPPVQEAEPVQAPSNEYLAPVEAEPAHELADDGYRYKTHRRVVYRQRRRRDAPSNEYLPPVQEAAPVEAHEVAVAVSEPAPAHELADDGYRYKTHRRVVYRRH